MRLSILDQAPISSNQTPKDALNASLNLAKAGEEFGYTRFWMAEHHDLSGLACPAPEVMLSYIGANTNKIRIGSGAILLPHYKPYKVAETFNLLSTLFPGRVDVGIGRAPGGSAEATNALSDHFLQNVWDMPDSLNTLLHFIKNDFPPDHEFAKLTASPLPPIAPQPWLLGTSKKSALLAAANGIPYAFGQFMSDNDGQAIIKQYLDAFQPGSLCQVPQVLLTVSAICAETTEKANEVALSTLIWSLQKIKGEGDFVPSIQEAKHFMLNENVSEKLEKMKQKMIIGNPQEVNRKLSELQAKYQADEIMIVTITYSPEDKVHSYKLIAEAVL